jgi:hypothetical protein
MCHETFTSDFAAQLHKVTRGPKVTCQDPLICTQTLEDGTELPALRSSPHFGGNQWAWDKPGVAQ